MRCTKIILTLFLLCSSILVANAQISIDDNVPAGNICFESVKGDTVYVHQDLRDTSTDWFYWAFRVKGAEGRTLTFIFTKSVAVGVRGPVVSTDKGRTYSYPSEEGATRNSFTYHFGKKEHETWFYECFPYTPKQWAAFVRHCHGIRTGVICKSPKGADVPFAQFGNMSASAPHKVVMTSRHHCSEAVATYVVEGFCAAFVEKSELGDWLRANVGLYVVPFTDYDGVVAGDQGKNRKPHDHNRDYTQFLYPETKAISNLLKETSPEIFLDVHCPWLYSSTNEYIYTPFGAKEKMHDPAAEAEFSRLLEKNQEGGLRYKASDDMPYGTSWNTGANYTAGLTSDSWANKNIPSLRVCRSLEIPFANAGGAVVTPEALRTFGHGLAKALREFLEQ